MIAGMILTGIFSGLSVAMIVLLSGGTLGMALALYALGGCLGAFAAPVVRAILGTGASRPHR